MARPPVTALRGPRPQGDFARRLAALLAAGVLLVLLAPPVGPTARREAASLDGTACASTRGATRATGPRLGEGESPACVDATAVPSGVRVRPADGAPALRGPLPHVGAHGTRGFALDAWVAARHVRLGFDVLQDAAACRIRALPPQCAERASDRPTVRTRPLRGPPPTA